MGMGWVLLKKRDQRVTKTIVVTVTITLLTYITLDAIYTHAWFAPENAVVVPLIQSMVTLAGVSFLLFIQQKQKQPKPLGTVTKRASEVKPTRAWYFVAFFLGIIGGIIGYFVVKDDDKPLANRLLILGLATTLSVASYVTFLNAVLLKPIPIPMPPT